MSVRRLPMLKISTACGKRTSISTASPVWWSYTWMPPCPTPHFSEVTRASMLLWSQVSTRMLASEVSTRNSACPAIGNAFFHSSPCASSDSDNGIDNPIPIQSKRRMVTPSDARGAHHSPRLRPRYANPVSRVPKISAGNQSMFFGFSAPPPPRRRKLFQAGDPDPDRRFRASGRGSALAGGSFFPIGISHPNQSPLRERKVQQPSRCRESGPESNLRRQQERRHRPQLIHGQDGREQPLELLPQEPMIESHRRNEVAAQRNADSRCHQHCHYDRHRTPSRQKRVRNPVRLLPMKQGLQVEDQVHDLDKQEQSSREPAPGNGNSQLREKPHPPATTPLPYTSLFRPPPPPAPRLSPLPP